MKRVCCSALFRGLIEHRDGLEWTLVSEGNEAGSIAAGLFCRHGAVWEKRFLQLYKCPYCAVEDVILADEVAAIVEEDASSGGEWVGWRQTIVTHPAEHARRHLLTA